MKNADHRCVPDCTEQGHIADTGRHPKWQPVSPGTVIPAGQPYRVEWAEYDEMYASEYVINESFEVTATRTAYFVDSSWRPPLELPTEPTWGIAVLSLSGGSHFCGRWTRDALEGLAHTRSSDLLDFIELTPEQVERIERKR